MIVFCFFEDEKDKKDKNTRMDIKVRGTGIYAVEKFPPCEKGEAFQALEFLRWDSNNKVYRKSLWLEYTGYRIGPLKFLKVSMRGKETEKNRRREGK